MVLVALAGTAISCRAATAWSTAAKFIATIFSPFLPYVFWIVSLIAWIAAFCSMMPER